MLKFKVILRKLFSVAKPKNNNKIKRGTLSFTVYRDATADVLNIKKFLMENKLLSLKKHAEKIYSR